MKSHGDYLSRIIALEKSSLGAGPQAGRSHIRKGYDLNQIVFFAEIVQD
jgi:hypothetical protein